MRPTNMATPEQVAAFRKMRDKVSQHFERIPKSEKHQPVRVYVPQTLTTTLDGWSLQLPLYAPTPNKMSRNRHVAAKEAEQQVSATQLALIANFRHLDRESIEAVSLIRISPQKADDWDNLRSSFKHVFDATCRWIVRGNECLGDTANIGIYDDLLIDSGRIECPHYAQEIYEHDRMKVGIRIRFRLRPRS